MPLHGPGTLDGIFAPLSSDLGDVTYSSDQSFTEDRYYHNLTINNNRTIATNGYALIVTGTLTIGDNVIVRPGVLGAGGSASGFTPGAAGTNLTAGTHGGSWYSAAAGGTTLGGNATTLSPSIGIHMGGGGGGGGGAGNGVAGVNDGGFGARGGPDGGAYGVAAISPGGNGGNGALLVAPENQVPASTKTGMTASLYSLLTGHALVLGTLYPLYGGNGGGGGGGDGVAEAGGGGGAGGGIIRILARKIVRSGSGTAPIIRANGGPGGNGQTPDGAGGGGGGGGLIMIGYGYISPTIVVETNGGAGGAGGSNGGTGGSGAAGRVFKFEF